MKTHFTQVLVFAILLVATCGADLTATPVPSSTSPKIVTATTERQPNASLTVGGVVGAFQQSLVPTRHQQVPDWRPLVAPPRIPLQRHPSRRPLLRSLLSNLKDPTSSGEASTSGISGVLPPLPPPGFPEAASPLPGPAGAAPPLPGPAGAAPPLPSPGAPGAAPPLLPPGPSRVVRPLPMPGPSEAAPPLLPPGPPGVVLPPPPLGPPGAVPPSLPPGPPGAVLPPSPPGPPEAPSSLLIRGPLGARQKIEIRGSLKLPSFVLPKAKFSLEL